jgi:hypothetical protein
MRELTRADGVISSSICFRFVGACGSPFVRDPVKNDFESGMVMPWPALSDRRGASFQMCRLLNDPVRSCPRGLGRGVPEAMPGGFNLRLAGPVATRPCLGRICREFSDVEPNN